MSQKQPGIPRVVESSSNSVTLMWDEPVVVKDTIKFYVLQYRHIAQERWKYTETETNINVLILPGLAIDSCYECRVRAMFNDDEEGPYSGINRDVKTKQSISKSCLPLAVETTHDKGTFYQLNLKEDVHFENSEVKTRRCILETELSSHAIEKTIMLLGETGSGKSTLIDVIVNYLMGVELEDSHRLRIIDLKDEERNKKNDQTQSQTEWITCYTIPSMRSEIKYSLNVIDTPGFGDTQGLDKDKALFERIGVFFKTPPPKGICSLDAVCFVTQASMSRLTCHQKYIFSSVMSLFGKDMSENIFVFATYADCKVPPVIEALKTANLPFQGVFKFNNTLSCVTAECKPKEEFDRICWELQRKSFGDFFIELMKTETRSLQLTAEVIDTRKRLEAESQGLQLKIVESLDTFHTIIQEKMVIENHEKDILANKNFEYETVEPIAVRMPTSRGECVTNCTICKRTCHCPCTCKWKRFCYAMNKLGNCKICDIKCSWKVHENTTECYFSTVQYVKRNYDDLKTKYEIAKKSAERHRDCLTKLEERLKEVFNDISVLFDRIQCCNNDLDQKALRQNPLSIVGYIEMIMKSEERNRRNGWQNRVELLKEFKMQAESLNARPGIKFIPWTDETLKALVTKVYKL